MPSTFNISTEEIAHYVQQNKWNDLARKRFTIHSFATTILYDKTPHKTFAVQYEI